MKVVYVRNLSPTITEEKLKEIFEPYGEVDRVKKIKDYAFVHFTEREHAIKAIEDMNEKELDGIKIEVSLAKPRDGNQPKDRRQGQSGFGSLNTRSGRARGGGRGRGMDGGRGRGGGGGYDRGGYDYGGRDSYYDDGYGGGYGGDYGGYGSGDYYDSYYGGSGGGGGYDGYYSGGGGRGGPPRGRGSSRGGGPRGGGRGGGSYGGGGYGGDSGYRGRGRGGRGGDYGDRGRGGRGGLPPSKRKYGADAPAGPGGYPEPKKRYSPDQNYWGSQPIAQAPQYGSGYGESGQEWYQDSYGQQWN